MTLFDKRNPYFDIQFAEGKFVVHETQRIFSGFVPDHEQAN